jgi:2-polyprenyl-6-methoxyphenol hydroxylase-like FAD-dependent oxidoreductase/phytoene/squalene synthetase
MPITRSIYDVAVIGAGPAGTVTAIAFARQGASVLLLEANPAAASRLAGEWIHPPGVDVLRRLELAPLEEASRHPAGRGFVVFPDDGGDPIELPYPDASVAMSCGHRELVDALRARAQDMPEIDYLPLARVIGLRDAELRIERRNTGEIITVGAGLIVGADGRSSIARQYLGLEDNSTLLSHMAGIELFDVDMPFEGFGHVILGGPGPALLYRISPTRARLCLDLPAGLCNGHRDVSFLWRAFRPVLPASLVPAFQGALESRRILWAATRFRPRSDYGRGRIALVGDAVGSFHPLTAVGITMGLRDAEILARSRDVDEYRDQRTRQSYIPELLSNALYHVFRRDDAGAESIRTAVYRMWGHSADERRRTMRILTGEDFRAASFAGAFLRVAAGAMGNLVVDGASDGRWRRLLGQWRGTAQALGAYGEWLQWPAASLVPHPLRSSYQARSTPQRPIPDLPLPRSPVPSPAPSPSGDARRARRPGLADDAEDDAISSALARSTMSLMALLASAPDCARARDWHRLRRWPRIVMALGVSAGASHAPGHAPDHVPGGAALPGADESRAARRVAAERRRLADELLPGLVSDAGAGSRARWTSDWIAEVILALVEPEPNFRLDPPLLELLASAALRLLQCQAPEGGFAPVEIPGALARIRRRRASNQDTGVESTALCTRALHAVRRSVPGLLAGAVAHAVDQSLVRATGWLREHQDPSGFWALPGGVGQISATAWAIEALLAAGVKPTDPSVRRAWRWLILCQDDEGSWSEDSTGNTRVATARAVRALLVSRSPYWESVQRGVRALLRSASVPADEVIESGEACAVVDALASYRAWSEQRLPAREQPSRAPGNERRATSPAGRIARGAAVDEPIRDDLAFCHHSLAEVSRTFSRPIAMLPESLRVAVTCGYLLCRIADTVEDRAELAADERDDLFAAFLDCLSGRHPAEAFAELYRASAAMDSSAESVLAASLPRVMRVFGALPGPMRESSGRWIAELARGMSIYSHRPRGDDGLIALLTEADLDRYCYFVAGTVGHLLTELFKVEVAGLGRDRTRTLEAHAEAFGAGLQLVNILKDITDDRQRGWSFVPRTACAAQGIEVADLIIPDHRVTAHRVVAPIFDHARGLLDRALDYSLAIPPAHQPIRLFCLLPLWMAARTLIHARGNDAMFTTGEPVKLARPEIETLIADCLRHADDDGALRRGYRELWRASEPGADERRTGERNASPDR